MPVRGQRGHAEALPLGAAPLLPLARHRLGPPLRHDALAVTTRASASLSIVLDIFVTFNCISIDLYCVCAADRSLLLRLQRLHVRRRHNGVCARY